MVISLTNCDNKGSLSKAIISILSTCSWTFSGRSIESMDISLTNCDNKGSLSKAIISILSTCSCIFSGLSIEPMNISLINCDNKGSLSKAIISILSTCSCIFSGLCILNIVISSIACLWFSGFSILCIYNSLINCTWRGSFSYPSISIALICSSIFSGLVSLNKLICSMNSFSFSGLGTSSIYNDSINCNIKGSLSYPIICIAFISSITFSSFGSFNIVNSPLFWMILSSLFIGPINNSFICWYCKGSLGYGWISILFIWSIEFSGLTTLNIVISSIFWNSLTGLDKDSINNSSIFFIIRGSFSCCIISKLFICSMIISGFVPSKRISSFLCWIFSGRCISSIYNDSISCNINGSFSKPITLIL